MDGSKGLAFINFRIISLMWLNMYVLTVGSLFSSFVSMISIVSRSFCAIKICKTFSFPFTWTSPSGANSIWFLAASYVASSDIICPWCLVTDIFMSLDARFTASPKKVKSLRSGVPDVPKNTLPVVIPIPNENMLLDLKCSCMSMAHFIARYGSFMCVFGYPNAQNSSTPFSSFKKFPMTPSYCPTAVCMTCSKLFHWSK
mmetsp:Transcript_13325/g.20086  ORF Transcript_13325/g.20086 Transcript_13325/m.20086 type:complete len:200 (+) Transcript_13325:1064-1663(+)